MAGRARSKVAVAPPGLRAWLADAVVAGGGTAVEPVDASGLVWTDPDDPGGLDGLLVEHPDVAWVQLPWAGIEPYVEVIAGHRDRTWTCGKGVYAEPVAEHALALALAGLRHVPAYARASTWTEPAGRNLLGAGVVVLGGGGITASLLRLLEPFGCHVTVVRRTGAPLAGAATAVGPDQLEAALGEADVVVLALALTPATRGVIDASRLALLPPHAVLVNVARGEHVVTDDLVTALAGGAIGAAALDVTDPEPLPDGHALWHEPRCLLTPHVGNTPAMAAPLLSARVTDNVRRWIADQPLVGPVDLVAGY